MGTKNPSVDVHVSLDHAIEMLRMAQANEDLVVCGWKVEIHYDPEKSHPSKVYHRAQDGHLWEVPKIPA